MTSVFTKKDDDLNQKPRLQQGSEVGRPDAFTLESPIVRSNRHTLRQIVSTQFDKVSPGLRRILGNMGWLFFDRVVRMGMGLFVGVWVARYLGPDQFGSLNFAVAFVALFGTMATLGLDGIVVREVLHKPEDMPEILGTTLALRIGGSLLAVGAAVATVRLIQPQDRRALLLVSLYAPMMVFQALDTIDLLFQSQVRSKITVWVKNGAFLVFAAARVLLIYAKAPLWTFVAALTGEIALGAVALGFAYRVSGGRIFLWRTSKSRAAQLLNQGWPVIFSGLAIMVYMRLDMVMLKMMQGDVAVGLYAAATRVSEVWYFIPTAIVSSVSPAIMRSKDNPELFSSRLRRLFSLMTLSACVIGSIVALASHAIIRTLYSGGYSSAAPVLAVHVWASVFVFLGVAQSPWYLSKGLLKLSLCWTTLGAVVNIVMNFYLIPKYSAMGAAIATVVSYAVSGVFANALSARTRPIFYMQMKSFLPQRFWI